MGPGRALKFFSGNAATTRRRCIVHDTASYESVVVQVTVACNPACCLFCLFLSTSPRSLCALLAGASWAPGTTCIRSAPLCLSLFLCSKIIIFPFAHHFCDFLHLHFQETSSRLSTRLFLLESLCSLFPQLFFLLRVSESRTKNFRRGS